MMWARRLTISLLAASALAQTGRTSQILQVRDFSHVDFSCSEGVSESPAGGYQACRMVTRSGRLIVDPSLFIEPI